MNNIIARISPILADKDAKGLLKGSLGRSLLALTTGAATYMFTKHQIDTPPGFAAIIIALMAYVFSGKTKLNKDAPSATQGSDAQGA